MPGLLDLIPVVGDIINKVIPDPVAKAELQLKLATLADQENVRQHDEMLGQIDVNKTEAANPSVFVAGWRPAIGWGCGAALLYNTLLAPAFHLGVADLGFLQTVLMAMLGIGGMRTYEKVKGVETQNVGTQTVGAKEAGQPAAPLASPPQQKRKKFLGIF